MPIEIVALVDKPHLLLIVLGVGAFFGIVTERFMSGLRRSTSRQKNRRPWPRNGRANDVRKPWPVPREEAGRKPDAADQLRTVMGAVFTIQPLLNTAARDAVKKEALRRAGIGYHEVAGHTTPAELRRLVEKLVDRPARR